MDLGFALSLGGGSMGIRGPSYGQAARVLRKTYVPSGRWEGNVFSTLKLVRQETTGYDFSSILFLSHVS